MPSVSDPVDEVLARRQAERLRRTRSGAVMLSVAAVLHLLAIPAALLVLKMMWGREMGRPTWDQFFDAIAGTTLAAIVVAGVFVQVILAMATGMGAAFLFHRPSELAYVMIATGIVGILFSFLVFGGIIGAAGGILALAGGTMALPSASPTSYSRGPPPRHLLGPP